MNWLATGLYDYKVIDIHFDYNEETNNKILHDKKLRKYFIDSWISILSSELDIQQDYIYIHSMCKGSGHLKFALKTDNIDQNGLKKIKEGREGIVDIR